jgi:hypothetical protein
VLDGFFEGVELLHCFCPPVRGWEHAAATIEHAASLYRDGEVVGFDAIAKTETADLAYIVELERYKAKIGGSDENSQVTLPIPDSKETVRRSTAELTPDPQGVVDRVLFRAWTTGVSLGLRAERVSKSSSSASFIMPTAALVSHSLRELRRDSGSVDCISSASTGSGSAAPGCLDVSGTMPSICRGAFGKAPDVAKTRGGTPPGSPYLTDTGT